MGVGHPVVPSRDSLARAGLRLAAVIIVAVVAGALSAGCPSPRLPVVEGCTVRASRCHNGRPQACSSTGRWHDAADTSCPAGSVCIGPAGGEHAHCGVAADGGAL